MPSTIAKTPTGIGRAGTQVWTEDDGRYCRLYSTIIAKLSLVSCEKGKETFELRLDLSYNSPTTRRRIEQVTNHWLGHSIGVSAKQGRLRVHANGQAYEVGSRPRLIVTRQWLESEPPAITIDPEKSDFNK